MFRRNRTATLAVSTAAVVAVVLTGCSSGGNADTGSSTKLVSGGTFTLAVNDDPGSLSPLTGVSLVQRQLVPFAYESLVYTTEDGKTLPWLAKSWKTDGKTATFTLQSSVTCSDGTPFTAETAAANINYQADKSHGTFWNGSNVTTDEKATADGDELTVTSAANNPFLISTLGAVEMVCQKGLDDPDSLKAKTDGTALYALTTAKSGSSYTYTKRKDHTWGPEGVTSETKGLPETITARVITDASTASNLLLSGDLNAATLSGSNTDRLKAAGLKSKGTTNPLGEMLFNERSDRPTSDERVRQALTLSLDRKAVGKLVTGGSYDEMHSLVVATPFTCVADGPKWKLPARDVEKAGELLDAAGWKKGSDGLREKDGQPLTIRFLYDGGTPTHAPAAEEVQEEWKAIGVTTKLVAEDPTGWSTDLYQKYDWDTGFIQLAPSSPVVLSLFFLGATSENGGYNFMDVQNTEYNTLAKKAMTASSADSACDTWLDAEKELIDRVDIYPLASTKIPTFFKGATADIPGTIQPTTIRMLG